MKKQLHKSSVYRVNDHDLFKKLMTWTRDRVREKMTFLYKTC